jgi:hypothetical protein
LRPPASLVSLVVVELVSALDVLELESVLPVAVAAFVVFVEAF